MNKQEVPLARKLILIIIMTIIQVLEGWLDAVRKRPGIDLKWLASHGLGDRGYCGR